MNDLAADITAAFAAFLLPADDALSGLMRASAATPQDETLVLVVADRLDELNLPALAQLYRLLAAALLYQRSVYEATMDAFRCACSVSLDAPATSSS